MFTLHCVPPSQGSFRQPTWRPSCISCVHQVCVSSFACSTTCCSSTWAHSSFASFVATSSSRSVLSGSFPSDGIHNCLSTSSAHQSLCSAPRRTSRCSRRSALPSPSSSVLPRGYSPPPPAAQELVGLQLRHLDGFLLNPRSIKF